MEPDASARKTVRGINPLAQWAIIGALVTFLYLTGLHTPLISGIQRLMLYTGLFNARAGEIGATDGPFLEEQDFSFAMMRSDGTFAALGDFRGKVTFINVWASWCPPCLAEMPTIAKLHQELSEHEEIRFILLSVDQDPDAAREFMRKSNHDLPVFFPATPIPPALQGRVVPTSYVISADGQVVYRKEGMADYSARRFREWLIELGEASRESTAAHVH